MCVSPPGGLPTASPPCSSLRLEVAWSLYIAPRLSISCPQGVAGLGLISRTLSSPSILVLASDSHPNVTWLLQLRYNHVWYLITGAARLPVVWAVRREQLLCPRVILLRWPRWGTAGELGSSLRRVEQPRVVQQVELGCSTSEPLAERSTSSPSYHLHLNQERRRERRDGGGGRRTLLSFI